MLLAEPDYVRLSRERLAAREEVHVHAQLLALAYDVAQLVVAHGEALAVVRSPAARAAQVASRCRVHEYGPRHVAAVFAAQLRLTREAYQIGVDNEIFKHLLDDVGVNVAENVHDQLVHAAVRLVEHLADGIALRRQILGVVGSELIHPAHKLVYVPLRVLGNVIKGSTQRCLFEFCLQLHR